MKKGVAKNFTKFSVKYLRQRLRPATLLKRDCGTGVFLRVCEIFKNTFFTEHLRTTGSKSSLLNVTNSAGG